MFVANGEEGVADSILTDIGQVVFGIRVGRGVRKVPRAVGLHLELDIALLPVVVAAGRIPTPGSARGSLDGEEGECPTLVHRSRLEGRLRPLETARTTFRLVVVAAANLADDDREVSSSRHRSGRRRGLDDLRVGRAESKKRNATNDCSELRTKRIHNKVLLLLL